jgi:UDP-glucose 4-epimerase
VRVFVTGGAGYIGSVAVEALQSAGHDVVVYDSLKSGHRGAVPKAVELIQGDVLDFDHLYRSLKPWRADAVMHFASEIVVSESFRDPELHFRVNLGGGLNVLQAMRACGVSNIVFSSSAAVYGNPDIAIITEDAPKAPVSPYGLTKLQFEQVLEWYGRAHGFRHVSLRYFNACGATEANGEDRAHETHLIPLLIEAAKGRREGVRLFGTDYPTPDGTCIRDYVHVADIARAHVLSLEALEELKFPVYNLGTGRGHSNREVIAAVERVSGRRIEVSEAPRREGDPARLVASADRVSKELGWRPEVESLDEMVASAWRWRQAHPEGYRD